jgi:N-acetylmuramic acid 6-phosphate etherase
MAVTGSTRMQSSTVLLAAAGIALFYYDRSDRDLSEAIAALAEYWAQLDIHFIEGFIVKESEFYRNGEYLLYETDNQLGITVITDTTERSPTFSLYPFENIQETKQNLSLCYLYLPDSPNSEEAWNSLLWRSPRTLEWSDINGIASRERLLGFDFSAKAISRREQQKKSIRQHRFKITYQTDGIKFILENEFHFLAIPFKDPLLTHLVLKMILNSHSTLIMGRLDRYQGNVMTFVRASNNKLIDRAIRYIDLLLKSNHMEMSYHDLAHILFEMIEKTPVDQSIVLSTVSEIVRRNK